MKVFMKLIGNLNETGVRILNEDNKLAFQQSAVNTFLMSVKRPLGELIYMKIWHDNSGHGDKASWFLKHVIVRDLQTKEKFYFSCQKWMAIEKGDGKLERELFVTDDESKNNKDSENSFLDFHLWLSVFYKPILSSFTRLDRVTCCFVFHYLSMFLSILYYDTTETNSNDANRINFVFFEISFRQVNNLLLFLEI
jgi:hypothetical protein